jgi:hypothetical protein
MTVVSAASKATMIILDSVVVFVISSFFWFLYFTYRRTIKFKITEVTTRIGDAGSTSGSCAVPLTPEPDAPEKRDSPGENPPGAVPGKSNASKHARPAEGNKMWKSSAAEIGRLNRLANLKYKGYPYPRWSVLPRVTCFRAALSMCSRGVPGRLSRRLPGHMSSRRSISSAVIGGWR